MRKEKPTRIKVAVLITGLLLFVNGFRLIYISSPVPEIRQALKNGGINVSSDRVHIESVIPGSPAADADMQKRDVIVSVNNESVHDIGSVTNLMASNKGNLIAITIDRNGTILTKNVTPRSEYPRTQGPLGVTISDREIQKVSFFRMVTQLTWEAYSGKFEIFPGTTYLRVLLLAFGTFSLSVAMGLRIHKKWAVYLFTLIAVSALYNFLKLLTGVFYGDAIDIPFVAKEMIWLTFTCLGVYLFLARKYFS